jgi:regulator of protease activity HflC (stomatin/prohibitin superfamily)
MDSVVALSLVVGALGAVALLWKQRRLLRIQRPEAKTAMWGYVAIPAGEQWSVCATDGSVRTLSGPFVVFCWGDSLTPLTRRCASSSEYIRVQFVDGKTEILSGPAMLFVDPLVHQHVEVKKAVSLSESELLVVYREEGNEGDRSVKRHIVRGPCLHVPLNSSEWTLEFSWHGSTSDDPERNGRKVKGAARFTSLRTCPEQSYIDVEGVRTRDDAVVRVKVMLFYRMVDVELMLQETHDPIADFVNALSSDVVEFVGARTFEEFKTSTEHLNELESYSQLVSRAKGIGFEVTKVVFRGYGAPPQLQKMHDDAIERRTRLVLDRESSEQEQSLQDMKLQREESRVRIRRQMDAEAKRHELEMQREAKAHAREMQQLSHEADLDAQRAKAQATLESQNAASAAELQHLVQMQKELGLSSDQLSAYLTAKIQGKPEKLIQIGGHKSADALSEVSSLIQVQMQA